jgi:hypothetical protein
LDREQTYFIIDGDKIGDHIAHAYLANSEAELIKLDHRLREGLSAAEILLRERSMFMIAYGADGITCRGIVDDPGSLLFAVIQLTKPFTFSMGCGKTLREAYVCLRFAKASGRSSWAQIDGTGRINAESVNGICIPNGK